jgi:hypothetical protein
VGSRYMEEVMDFEFELDIADDDQEFPVLLCTGY